MNMKRGWMSRKNGAPRAAVALAGCWMLGLLGCWAPQSYAGPAFNRQAVPLHRTDYYAAAQGGKSLPARAFAGLSPMQQGLLRQLASRGSFSPVDGPSLGGEAHGFNSSRPALCFAPGTPVSVVQRYDREVYEGSLSSDYRLSNSWSSTATNGSGISRGTPITLIWSIVPDGTFVPSRSSGGADGANSNLRAFLNGIYGSEASWLPLFQQVFDRWGQLTGVTYIYQPTDDGAAMPGYTGTTFGAGAPGLANTRGDVRISGRFIDGASNVLAYNYFPDIGDMVIDTGDTAYNNVANNSILLRNTLWHEHGHGLGFAHTCPGDNTKLMEPFLSTSFAGPQLDDTLAANRGYGDPLEKTAARNNDSAANATNFGTLSNGTLSRGAFTPRDSSFANDDLISIDGTNDVDMFGFSVSSGRKQVTAVLHPLGGTYLEAGQNNDGSCPSGTSFNAQALNNLSLQLIGNDGTTVLTSQDVNPAGQDEQITYVLPNSSGPFYLRVAGSTDNVQLYTLGLTLADAPSAPFFTSGGTTTVSDTAGNGNSNGRPDPGESSVALTIPVLNQGAAAATGVSATLTSLTSTVSIVTGTVTYPNIAAGATASNASPFVISVSSSLSCGTPIQLRLTVTSSTGTNAFDLTLQTGTVATQTFAYAGSAVAIPDGAGNNVSGAAATATINVSGVNSIADLNFAIDGTSSNPGLSHTYVGDLVATLTSPSGTVVTLFNRIGGGNTAGPNFAGTIFDDEASTSIQNVTNTQAPFTGSFVPAGSLSAFDGENPNGTWTLSVRDEYNGDTGTIRAFSLRITALTCAAPRVNQAPVNSVPAAQTLVEDNTLIFSSVSGKGVFSISDADAGSGALMVSLRPRNGRISFNNGTSGLTFVKGSSATSVVKLFTGTLSAINAALGNITFTPIANYNSADYPSSPASITITTNDQGNTGGAAMSDSDTVVITITAVNDNPTARNDAVTLASGNPATVVNVLTNDSSAPDRGETLSVSAITGGTRGTVTNNGSSVSYTPTNAAYVGTDSFTYTLSDGNGGSATAKVTVTYSNSAAVDYTTRVSVRPGGFTYNGATGHYYQMVILTNVTSPAVAIPGPLYLALDNLTPADAGAGTAAVTLVGATGTTAGSPYILVSSDGLAAGASTSVILEFNDPDDVQINYTPRVLAGGTPAP